MLFCFHANVFSAGPQKLARVLGQCLAYMSNVKKRKADEKSADYAQINANSTSSRNDLVSLVEDIQQKSINALQILKSNTSVAETSSPARSRPPLRTSIPSFDPSVGDIVQRLESIPPTPRPKTQVRTKVLLVEDNIINMKVSRHSPGFRIRTWLILLDSYELYEEC